MTSLEKLKKLEESLRDSFKLYCKLLIPKGAENKNNPTKTGIGMGWEGMS